MNFIAHPNTGYTIFSSMSERFNYSFMIAKADNAPFLPMHNTQLYHFFYKNVGKYRYSILARNNFVRFYAYQIFINLCICLQHTLNTTVADTPGSWFHTGTSTNCRQSNQRTGSEYEPS